MAKTRKLWRASVLGSLGSVLVGGYLLSAQDAPPADPQPGGLMRIFNGLLPVAAQATAPGQAQPPGQAAQQPTPARPPPAPATAPVSPSGAADTQPSGFSRFAAPESGNQGTNTASGSQGVLSQAQTQQAAANPSANVVSGGEAATRSTTDTGDLLGKSLSGVGVWIHRRNPIVTEPRIRGFRMGQITTTADGGLWIPARPDLDTIVSKIDSSNIANIVVIKGPYTVRQGPGFTFLDIETLGSPRFDKFEVHGVSQVQYRHNGDQVGGRQSVWGGGADYGFRASYDVMAGNDYRTGGPNLEMPSSYNSQNASFAFGFDLTENSQLELRALHLSQRNIEFPGVVTDLNKAITDGYSLRYVATELGILDRFTVDAWYNDTRIDGDSLRPSKTRQIPELLNIVPGSPFPVRFTVETNGETHSYGFREAMTWGRAQEMQVTTGLDFTYLSQALNEFDTTFTPGLPITQNFPIPRSFSTDPGAFVDLSLPVGDRLTVRAGSRVDFHQAQLRKPLTFPFAPPPATPEEKLTQPGELGPNALTTQHFDLYSGYLTSEYKLTEELVLQGGYGYAQRPPTLAELFTDQTFLSLVQRGLSFIDGNPDLKQERMHQVDLGLKGSYEYVRAGASGFYADVTDFITFQALGERGVFREYRFINTPHASLTGGEGFAEVDATEWLTPFATVMYVSGYDISRREPLPGIPPLESRLGFRVHEASRRPRWATELAARMVARQERIALTLGNPATAAGFGNEAPTAGFTIFDVRSYWQVNENMLLTAGIENFTDKFYREHLDLRSGIGQFQPGINAYVGVRVSY